MCQEITRKTFCDCSFKYNVENANEIEVKLAVLVWRSRNDVITVVKWRGKGNSILEECLGNLCGKLREICCELRIIEGLKGNSLGIFKFS